MKNERENALDKKIPCVIKSNQTRNSNAVKPKTALCRRDCRIFSDNTCLDFLSSFSVAKEWLNLLSSSKKNGGYIASIAAHWMKCICG